MTQKSTVLSFVTEEVWNPHLESKHVQRMKIDLWPKALDMENVRD